MDRVGEETDDVIPYSAVWDQDELRQVLRELDRMNERSGFKQFAGLRRHERHPYYAMVTLRRATVPRSERDPAIVTLVAGRNLSRSGLGALAPMFFISEYSGQSLPALDLFEDGALLELGLKQNCGKSLWLTAAVVRARIVQHDFLDVGLKFRARLNVSEVLETRSSGGIR